MASTTILVANTKKEVVYSTKCFDQGYSAALKSEDSDEAPSTQLVVEYQLVALEQAPMAPGDIHDVIKYTDATIDVINGCLKIGAFAFPPAAPVLLAIAGVGSFIQTLMGIVPDNRPDPVVEKYKKLELAIQKLDKQMNVHFDDLKAFLTENRFVVEIMTASSTLMRYMRDCMKHQNKRDVANFRQVYEQNSPLDLVYKMASHLEQKSTNPLWMAMEAEQVKSKATFNKWKTIIEGILGEFLFIETFASGLLYKENPYNRNKIVDQWNEIKALLAQWEEEYGKDQKYWEDFKTYMDDFIPKRTDLNNIQKGEELKKKLDSYLTNDAFYICVFNQTEWNKAYTYYCDKEPEQLAGVWKKGRCNAFVYRSRQGAKKSQNAYDSLRSDMRACEEGRLKSDGSLSNIIKTQLLDKSLLHGYGFLCLMETRSCDPQISWLNAPPPEFLNKGPGHLSYAFLGLNNGDKREMKFLVSFK